MCERLGQRLITAALVIFLPCAGSGCAGRQHHLRTARQQFVAGDAAAAAQTLNEHSQRRRKHRDVAQLELAMAELFAGQTASAEARFRSVRDRFEQAEQVDAGEQLAKYLTDANATAYSGEPHEQVMIRAMLALTNLLRDGSDAEAYCLQLIDKQNQLARSLAAQAPGAADDLASQTAADRAAGEPLRGRSASEGLPDGATLEESAPVGPGQSPLTAAAASYQVALAPYLQGILRESTHRHYDDAWRNYAQVARWQPEFTSVAADLQRAQHGRHSAPGNGVLYVFAFVGQGPYKQETTAHPTSEALLIADRIVSAVSDHSLPPTIAPVKVPQLVVPPSQVAAIQVALNGRPVADTQTITDIGHMAAELYAQKYPRVVAEAVARRVLKKGAIYLAKDQLNVQAGWTDLAMNVAGIAWEGTERADTRCWSLLPARIQVARLELPARRYQLQLTPLGSQGPLSGGGAVEVELFDGRNTYALANFPTPALAGKILVSEYSQPTGGR